MSGGRGARRKRERESEGDALLAEHVDDVLIQDPLCCGGQGHNDGLEGVHLLVLLQDL